MANQKTEGALLNKVWNIQHLAHANNLGKCGIELAVESL